MRRGVKITLVSAGIFLLLVTGGGYYFLRTVGFIQKHDYDSVPPSLPVFKHPAVLIFSKTNGYRHEQAIPAANRLFSELAEEQGWDYFVTDNAAVHNPDVLNHFQLVIWNNVSGDVLTKAQRRSLKHWIAAGGGWLGIHGSGGDRSYKWQWYVNTLIGAQFVGHTLSPQFQGADVLVADPDLPITDFLPKRWHVPHEEWYAFASDPRDKGYQILLTVDQNSYITKGKQFWGWNDRMRGEHPVAWRHRLGKGRVFYSAIGHNAATYRLPAYRELLRRAMRWAMGADVKAAPPGQMLSGSEK